MTQKIKNIIREINKISKWSITKKIDHIGYEYSDNLLFVLIEIDKITVHLDIYFDCENICIINCYREKEHILSLNGTVDKCLLMIDEILTEK